MGKPSAASLPSIFTVKQILRQFGWNRSVSTVCLLVGFIVDRLPSRGCNNTIKRSRAPEQDGKHVTPGSGRLDVLIQELTIALAAGKRRKDETPPAKAARYVSISWSLSQLTTLNFVSFNICLYMSSCLRCRSSKHAHEPGNRILIGHCRPLFCSRRRAQPSGFLS